MSFGHGRLGVLKIDNSAGTLTDISLYCTNVDYPESLDTPETTTYGATAKSYIPGIRDAKASVTANADPTLDALVTGVMGVQGGTLATVSVEYGPMGNATGNPKYTFECFIANYKMSTPVGGIVTCTFDLQRTGAHTRATY